MDTTAATNAELLDPLFHAIYEGGAESPPWHSALGLLRWTLKAAHVALILKPPVLDQAGTPNNPRACSGQDANSYGHNHFVDPFAQLPQGKVVTAEEILGSEWRQSQIYQDYLLPLGVGDMLGSDILTSEGIECNLRVARPHRETPFSEDDRALCRWLLPHLKRSIRLHAFLNPLECETHYLAGSINQVALGVIGIGSTGLVLEMNYEASRILAENDGIGLSRDRLALKLDHEGRALECVIQKAIASGHGGGVSKVMDGVRVARLSGTAPFSIMVRTLPRDRWSRNESRPAAILYLRDPVSNREIPPAELLRRLFGLNRVEAALSMRLVQGSTLDEASEELSIGHPSARALLRSIFSKTGFTRQTMLVRHLKSRISLFETKNHVHQKIAVLAVHRHCFGFHRCRPRKVHD